MYVWDCVHVCIYTMEYLMCIQFVHSIYECVGVCVYVVCVRQCVYVCVYYMLVCILRV